MSSRWNTPLALAATAALAFAAPQDARADNQNTWPFQASEEVQAIPADTYPAISPELLDPGMVGNKEMQKRFIDDAARGRPYGFGTPDLVLTRDAAYTMVRGRAEGELPGAKEGQSPADWWRETEPKLVELQAEYKAERRLPLYIAGGFAGAMGLSMAASAGLGAYRRRKNGPGPTGEERLRARFGPGSGP